MITTRYLAALVVAVGFLVGGCLPTGTDEASTPSPPTSAGPIPLASEAAPSDAATPIPAASPELESVAPPASDPPAPTDQPSSDAGPAATCTGTADNRSFFADAAAALSFDVYCPVLPAGWFVDTGEYLLRNGGMLHVEYKGPGGARLDVTESGPCLSSDGCVPEGQELGDASFGGRPGTLIGAEDDYLVVASSDESGQWMASGIGLGRDMFAEIVADFVLVSG